MTRGVLVGGAAAAAAAGEDGDGSWVVVREQATLFDCLAGGDDAKLRA